MLETVTFEDFGDDPVPLLCFTGGFATFRIEYAIKSFDLSVEMRRNPDHWRQWVRTPEGIEYTNEDGQKLVQHSNVERRALPDGTRFSGKYLDYSETAAAGLAILNWTFFDFRSDGTFSTCSASQVAGASIGVSNDEEPRRDGHYEIADYGITLSYSDNKVESNPFFFSTQATKGLWMGAKTESGMRSRYFYVYDESKHRNCFD